MQTFLNVSARDNPLLPIVDKEFLTSRETASFLGISIQTLYKLSSKRILNSYRPSGRKIYFKKEDLLEWIEKGKRLSMSTLNKKSVKQFCKI